MEDGADGKKEVTGGGVQEVFFLTLASSGILCHCEMSHLLHHMLPAMMSCLVTLKARSNGAK